MYNLHGLYFFLLSNCGLMCLSFATLNGRMQVVKPPLTELPVNRAKHGSSLGQVNNEKASYAYPGMLI